MEMIILQTMKLKTYLSTVEREGNLKYEYNPFHNYQTDVDLYEVSTDVGTVLVPKGKAVHSKNGRILTEKKSGYWSDNNGYTYKCYFYEYRVGSAPQWYNRITNEIVTTSIGYSGDPIDRTKYSTNNNIKLYSDGELYATAGSLVDFTTDQLNFDLEHPVDITVQPSYDGSVNLILNDGKNIPRLINSRFSVRSKNTYERVDRIGENDTNIYNSEDFDKDTSLYFRYNTSPKIKFVRFIDGKLSVGQYCFYFTYCDADGNESDIIAESGLIPTFIGRDKDPNSMDGGIKNQNSNKGISIQLTGLDKSYNYIKVYQFRYFADYQQNRVYECKKLDFKYPVETNFLYLNITGGENGEMIDPNILNLSLFNPENVLAQAQCKNMLFFGNIVKNVDNYKELTDCALRIYPEIIKSDFKDIDEFYGARSSVSNNFGELNFGYYSIDNIYNRVGYFPEEYYRFGVVFMYSNGTLSNVYNTLGYDCVKNQNLIEYTENKIYDSDSSNISDGKILNRNYIKFKEDGWIIPNTGPYENLPSFANSKGVIKLTGTKQKENTIYGIRFNVHKEVIEYLKTLGITGLFFVRQKRIPTIIAQCMIMPMDRILEAPVISYKINDIVQYRCESFLNQIEGDEQSSLTSTYDDRLIKYLNDFSDRDSDGKYPIDSKAYAGICPDFLLNQPYFNQIFNGASFRIQQITDNSTLTQNERIYTHEQNIANSVNTIRDKVQICSVTEDVPTVAIKDRKFRLEAGKCEEAYRFRYARKDLSNSDKGNDTIKLPIINAYIDPSTGEITHEQTGNNSPNLVRGIYSPYLAIYSESKLQENEIYNIYLEEELNYDMQFKERMNSKEPFYAICDRYNFKELTVYTDSNGSRAQVVCFRGDCYSNTFTYRLNRNFNDPTLPNNDKIIQADTWKENYKIEKDNETEKLDYDKLKKISRSDVNAVKLGSWITIKVLSSCNYALRSNDGSYVSENALMGSERSFYPRSSLLEAGENKRPDSYLYNDAYRATLGFKCYFTLDDVNYIKNKFSNRIQYSAISIQDSYKNNFRYSLSTYFRDYSQEYGSIQKLVGFEGYLLVVFEHAICIAVINERVLAGQGDGEPVFINTKNVLPEELTVISDTYGTQWPESVVKSESGYVYGVDTIQKKIWRVKGQQLEILSDFKVNNFLINNITLSEMETSPIIGLRNVKTHYNNNKKDIMFTFYDNVYKDEEKTWNLCYNELLDQFITFYSWIPSYSENIDTQFFTFNRNTSKWLTLLNKCNANIPENTGVLLDCPYLSDVNNAIQITFKQRKFGYIDQTEDGTLYHESKDVENIEDIKFRLEPDHWGNWKKFSIDDQDNTLDVSQSQELFTENNPVVLLEITPYKTITPNEEIPYDVYWETETVALYLNNHPLKTDFYLHGMSGIIDCQEQLYPTHWYGEFHPFELEFIVNENIGQQKIFSDLVMISNKAEPESFHFEIEGDNYEFSSDKRAMYFRQEATKNLYQNLGSNILYDRKFTDVGADKYTLEQYYRKADSDYNSYTTNDRFNWDKSYPIESVNLTQQVKSTIFPLYYNRVDTYNEIYHKYVEMGGGNTYDFKNLSGSEIVWYRKPNQLNIVTHVKNSPIDRVGRLRGNSRYKEGKWHIQIPSIQFMQKNEQQWPDINNLNYNGESGNQLKTDITNHGSPLGKIDDSIKVPPIIINSVPDDITDKNVTLDKLPNIYASSRIDQSYTKSYDIRPYIQNGNWTYRREARIRDKWMKVRIRYSGKNLAVIHSIVTLYNLSYS